MNLSQSEGIISDTTITSASNAGLSLIKPIGSTETASTVTLTNSRITGIGRGINVSSRSGITLENSQVAASGSVGASVASSGLGISLVGGEAVVRNSSVTGSNHAVGVFVDALDSPAPRLVLDNASLTSQEGSGIVVSNFGTLPVTAVISIGNGSTISAANQTLIEIGLPGDPVDAVAQASITIDASSLSGNILAANGAIADLTMVQGASLTGTLDNLRSLSMNASTVNGTLNEPSGSTATATLAAGSVFTGNLNNLASLSLDASRINGDVNSAPGNQTAVTLNNASQLNGSVNNVASLSLDQSQMTGDARSVETLSLAKGSRLLGTVHDVNSMSIDATSTFAMVGDSTVGALSLNGGTIDMRAGDGTFHNLIASSMSGTGSFRLGTDLAGHISDKVNIEGQVEGNYGLSVQNTGVDPLEEDYALRVVHTGGGAGQFTVLNKNGLVDVGTFSYHLEQRDTDWYLVQNADTPIISPSAQTAIAVFSAAPTVWYGELSSLRSRMGELRGGRGQGGTWVRTYGNKFEVSATDQVNYQQTQYGVSFGVDTPLPAEDGQWLVGVMGGYSDSQLNMRLGSNGRVNSYYLGLYSTWLNNDGYYLDAVLKANRFSNKADVRMNDGEKAKGDYDNFGIGGSVEAGRHIQFDNGWFIEPYAQVAALWADGKHYELDNGMQVSSNRADSLLAKLGTHVGRTIALPSGGFVQPYVKVAAVQEFARNNTVKVNNTEFQSDLSGGRGELGVGVALQMTEALQGYADFLYSDGQNITQPWGANVGIRYAW
ncbi:autotransporter outer membrane beta-barrel domain-containing protein [Pseudomonas sp. NPDC089752]|uniref:autotransporter outer membrane beta-barrel domain-containing protein n=1 Tax=Pseudomonas sp. NPDC089752 TaxID=3364472 RepID=UPI0037FEA89F